MGQYGATTSNVWFTSDLHLSHRKVAETRGFGVDTELHDRAVMANLYDTVRRGDQLWILGDLSSGSSRSEAHALSLLDTFRGDRRVELHLVSGNHDSVHPSHRGAYKKQREFLEVFTSVQPFSRRRIENVNVWMSHFPWRGYGDRGPGVERYAECRLNNVDPEAWLLHGHTHFTDRLSSRNSVNIGVDAWELCPANIEDIRRIVKKVPQTPESHKGPEGHTADATALSEPFFSAFTAAQLVLPVGIVPTTTRLR